MKRKWLWGVVLAAGAAAAGWWLYRRAQAPEVPAYRFARVERGNLESSVSATGTVNPVTTVAVGTQVSGQIAAIYADFNDRVKKGQLIARIDTVLLAQAVRDATAGLARAQAQATKAGRDFDRDRQLWQQQMLSQSDYNASESALAVARAELASAEVTLARARSNLAYTAIYAPITGIVIERNVDVGQTVAASLAAPQLFLIAGDLSRMQILAPVDESDIGLIREGQSARFTVQAWPAETFGGKVRQVRLQSSTTENVVNYTVVIDVENPAGRLLPGMTATVAFVTDSAVNALLVPNAALRLRATEAMTAQVRDAGLARGDSAWAGRASTGQLWTVDSAGRLALRRVRTGISDGQRTAVEGAGVAAGMRVIVGIAGAGPRSAATSNPFQGQTQQRPGPPPGF
jgi:HlyD family secretion protein